MKNINDNIKNALMKPTTQRKGRIFVNDQYYDVYNIEYYADGYDEGQVIGNAISTQLDFDLPYMPKFDKFKYYDGIFTGSDYKYIDMGTFTVFDEKDNDEFTKHITAFDKLIKFNAPFVSKGPYPKTLYEELQNVCEQAGVELENTSITNGSFLVENNQFVEGETLKTVLKAILSLSGDIGIIKNDKLNLLLENKTDFSMDKSQHEPVTWKRRSYGINQVIIGDSQIEGEYVIRQDEADIQENGVHKYIVYDDLFAYTQEKRNELINELFDKVKGFGYLPYELKGEWFNFLEVGDIITIDGQETRVLRINGKSPNALDSEMSAPAIIDSSIEFVDNTNDVQSQIKRTERSVDKQNQIIRDVIENVDGQDEKISKVEQTVDELRQEISHTVGLTIKEETSVGNLTIKGLANGEPVQIIIHPNGIDLGQTYPRLGQYPSNGTFTQPDTITLVIENVDTKEQFTYKLQDSLFYLDDTTYDIFEYTYGNNKCTITQNVGFRDGQAYKLDTPVVNEYDFPSFDLKEGDYNVYILGYSTGYLSFEAMTKNDYTDLFATKKELKSSITQTEDKIESEVSNVTSLLDKEVEKLDTKITQTAEGIEQTVTSYKEDTDGKIEDLNTKITQTATDITSQVTQTKTDLEGEIETLESTVTQTANSLTSEINKKVDTTTFNSRLSQTESSISSKVSKNDFSSLVQQNYNQVLIGFNNASRVIKLATDGISIYYNNDLRIKFDGNGMSSYRDGYAVGLIATAHYAQDSSQKGLVFNLDANGAYMGWFQRTSTSGSYNSVLYYARAGKFGQTNAGVHCTANFYGHNYTLSGFNIANTVANNYETADNKAIPVITNIDVDEEGNLVWEKSTINVRSGLITSVPKNSENLKEVI